MAFVDEIASRFAWSPNARWSAHFGGIVHRSTCRVAST